MGNSLDNALGRGRFGDVEKDNTFKETRKIFDAIQFYDLVNMLIVIKSQKDTPIWESSAQKSGGRGFVVYENSDGFSDLMKSQTITVKMDEEKYPYANATVTIKEIDEDNSTLYLVEKVHLEDLEVDGTSRAFKTQLFFEDGIYGGVDFQNCDLKNVNKIIVNDVGEFEGLIWRDTMAGIDVAPIDGGNANGYLRVYNQYGRGVSLGAMDTDGNFLPMLTLDENGHIFTKKGSLDLATTYYIDGVNGSDDNDGLSKDTPFKTVGRLMGAFNIHSNRIEVKVVDDLTITSDFSVPEACAVNIYGLTTDKDEYPIIDFDGYISSSDLNASRNFEVHKGGLLRLRYLKINGDFKITDSDKDLVSTNDYHYSAFTLQGGRVSLLNCVVNTDRANLIKSVNYDGENDVHIYSCDIVLGNECITDGEETHFFMPRYNVSHSAFSRHGGTLKDSDGNALPDTRLVDDRYIYVNYSRDITNFSTNLIEISDNIVGNVRKVHIGDDGLSGNWVNYNDEDGDYEQFGYYKVGGRVYLVGLVKSGDEKETIFTLPAGCRPNKRKIFNVYGNKNEDVYQIDVLEDGRVYMNTIPDNRYVSLENISFEVF